MGEARALVDGALGGRERGRGGMDEGERGEEREGEALMVDPGKAAGMEGLQSRRGGRSVSNGNQWNGGECEGNQVKIRNVCAVAPPQHVQ